MYMKQLSSLFIPKSINFTYSKSGTRLVIIQEREREFINILHNYIPYKCSRFLFHSFVAEELDIYYLRLSAMFSLNPFAGQFSLSKASVFLRVIFSLVAHRFNSHNLLFLFIRLAGLEFHYFLIHNNIIWLMLSNPTLNRFIFNGKRTV